MLTLQVAEVEIHMGVSKNRGNRTLKWMIWGYPIFGKHAYDESDDVNP